jgi:hypothetical protein
VAEPPADVEGQFRPLLDDAEERAEIFLVAMGCS